MLWGGWAAGRRPTWGGIWFGSAIVIGLAGLVLSAAYPLNGDVQYVLGGLAVSEHPPWDVFVHRPLLYRLLLAPVAGLPEPAPRLLGIAFAAAVGWALQRSFRRPALSIATAAALAVAPAWHFLQPEWFAAGFAALAVALRDRPALAGAALVATVAVKLATLPVAAAALLLIAVVERHRLPAVTAWATGIGLGWLGVSYLVEWQWLVDMAFLNSRSILRDGADDILTYLPLILTVAPVTIIGLLAIPSRRVVLSIGLVLAFALAAAPMVIQGKGTIYHLAAVPVLAAAVAAWRVPRLLPVIVLAVAVTTLPAWDWGTGRTNQGWEQLNTAERAALRKLSGIIGPEEEVLYLAYGNAGYHMRNPTSCRYPSPLFLRSGTDRPSAADNRSCLALAADHWVVVQPDWFRRWSCSERTWVATYYACPPGTSDPGQIP